MPKNKKKTQNKETPEGCKEAGNKAFIARQFDEAIDLYTKAIELSGDSPSHIYFGNRANAYLEQGKLNECIADCDKAISIDVKYIKAHFRKSKALFNQQKLYEALDAAKLGLENEDNLDLKLLSEKL